jgi:hypothetical protein
LRSRPDTCSAAPATGLAGGRGLRFPEKPRTSLRNVIHRLSITRTVDVPELDTAFPHLFPKSLVSVLHRARHRPGRDTPQPHSPNEWWPDGGGARRHGVSTLDPPFPTGADAEETQP